jgi:hypothetical protein
MWPWYLSIGVVLVALILRAWSKRRAPTRVTIADPVLGILNLDGSNSRSLIQEDSDALSALFTSVSRSEGEPLICDVLMVYCRIDPSGQIAGSSKTLREIIRDSEATVVVVATEHPVEAYIAGAPRTGFGHANLVMTLSRNGTSLPRFLTRLFSEMKRGVSMPVAWNSLAPQIPGVEHPDAPGTIFACERGQVVFGTA